MKTYKNIIEATEAAEEYFKNEFGHDKGVGIESRDGDVIEFYSKQDPGMDDTFYCNLAD